MGGGLMQLVAYGAQDIYLTGNPQITFFKVVYRRHTNFSMETIQQTLNGESTVKGGGANTTVTISRNGDLVHKVYACFDTAKTTALQGSNLFDEVELEIGGQRIDRHYKEWNQVWEELSTDESKAVGLKAMKGDVGVGASAVGKVQVPFNFWFCRNPGLALPLIALQYHEVKLKMKQGSSSAITTSDGSTPSFEVWCDYIYLDTDERRRFAQVSHEYLIEQLQREEKTTQASGASTFKLNFNHPVKELIWSYDASGTMNNTTLKLNGHDRFNQQSDESYFTVRQPFDYHTAVPRPNLPISARIGLSNNTVSNLTLLNTAGDLVAYTPGGAATSTQISMSDSTSLNVDFDTVGATIVAGDTLVLTVVGAAVTDTVTGMTIAAGDTFIASVASTPTSDDVTLSSGFTRTTDNETIATMVVGSGSSKYNLYKVTNTSQGEARTSKYNKKTAVYSFALKPEEHQPSGTCNFSRIDNAELTASFAGLASQPVTMYAVNYNVLRIMSGMGGLAYSN